MTELKTIAAVPTPGVLVHTLDEGLSDAKVLTKRVASITRLDLVDETCAVFGGLGCLVGQRTSATAHPLLRSECRTEVLLVVVFVEVGGGDLALLEFLVLCWERGVRL